MANLGNTPVTWSDQGTLNGAVMTLAWPVGCVFVCAVNTDPAKLLGMGKWSALPSVSALYYWQRVA